MGKYFIKSLTIVTCFVFATLITAQNKKTLDSLFNKLKSAKHDSTRCIIFREIADCYENKDTALAFYYRSLQLAKSKGIKNQEAKSLQCLGISFYSRSDFDKALQFYKNALSIYEEINDKKGIATCCCYIGVVYYFQGEYDRAIESLLKALKLAEALKLKSLISLCLMNIGNVYIDQRLFDKSIFYYNQSLKISEEIGDKKRMSDCFNNIGLIKLEQKEYNKAIDFFTKSLKIDEELNDKSGIALCYGNIGLAYSNQDIYNKAIENNLLALKYMDEVGNKNGMATVFANTSALYIAVSDMSELQGNGKLNSRLNIALEYGYKSYNLAKEINSIPIINTAAEKLLRAYKKLGNYNKSLEYAEIYIATNDSMFKEEKTQALTGMEAKYQNEKKQLEIDRLAKEKELQTSEMKKQRLIILFVVCGLLFVLGFSIVLFRLFIQKKKSNKIITEKNNALQIAFEEINTQKEEIIVQRDNIMEQKEIIEEHQKEIEDSINYAKRIQQAVLPDLTQILNTKYQNPNTKTQGGLELGTWSLEIESFILFKPKDIVSGDFYWATKVMINPQSSIHNLQPADCQLPTADFLIVTVADCTGHGVPGAFMSMLGISFLNEIVRKKEITKASDVLDQLRTSVIDALKQKGESGEQKDGMDIALCAINTKTLEMQFAGANNPCYVIANTQPVIAMAQPEAISTAQSDCFVPRNDEFNFVDPVSELSDSEPVELIEIKGDKMPIGIHSNMQPFTNQIYQLQKGDTIYLMSDGFEDQFGGPNRKKFMAKNLKNLLTAISQKRGIEPVEMSMANQKYTLETIITDWIGVNEQIDDITVLGIKIL